MTSRTGTSRTGLTRVELIATVGFVAVVAVVAAVLLWPSRPSPAGAGAGPAPTASWDDSALEPARRAAGLPPCPSGSGPAAGPLGGVRLRCLGAPGTAALPAGQDVLVNLWASWCAPCRSELPVLAEYAARPGAVPVLTIDERDDPRAALSLLADRQVRLPAAADPDSAVTTALHTPPGLPRSYLLRADGSVAPVTPPVPFASADAVAATVARLRTPGPAGS